MQNHAPDGVAFVLHGRLYRRHGRIMNLNEMVAIETPEFAAAHIRKDI